jgi:VIT1/CCC1 family predicted Fe2+/Mn2+ transporter
MAIAAETRAVVAEERSTIPALFRQLTDDVTHLARSEVKLARAEVMGSIHALVRPLIVVIAAALVGVAALFTLMGAFVGFLTPVVGSAGLAALIVAVILGLIAFVLLQSGLARIGKVSVVPERAVMSVKADVAAVKESLK